MDQQRFHGHVTFKRALRCASFLMLCALVIPFQLGDDTSAVPIQSSEETREASASEETASEKRAALDPSSAEGSSQDQPVKQQSTDDQSSAESEATSETATDATSTVDLSDQPTGTSPRDESTVRPSDGGRSSVDQPLVIFCWPGYVPQSVTDAFTKETGIEVLREYYNTNEELLRFRIVGRRYDLVQPSDYAAEGLIKRDALEPLRHERIPNLKNLDPRFRNLPHDPAGNYTVPWLAGTVGIVVNTSNVKDPIERYGDVFSGKYRGRIVAVNDPREWLGITLSHLGLPINDVNEESLRAVESVWRDWIPQVAVFDSDTAARVMLNGNADIAITWSGDAASLLAQSSDYKFVLPEEGAHRYVDCLAIPRGAPNRDAAEEFINFILRPEIGLMISAEIPFTNPNAKAFARLSEAQRTNPASYPQGDPDLRAFRSIGEMVEPVEKLFYALRFPVASP